MKLRPGMRKKGSGIEYRFQIDGKRYSVSGKDVKEVIVREQEVRQKIARNEDLKSGRVSMDKYFEHWLEHKRLTVKGSTLNQYKMKYKNHIKPYVGNKNLIEIERSDGTDMQLELSKKGLSAATINDSILLFKTLMNAAVTEQILYRSPVRGIPDLPENKNIVPDIHIALSKEEQDIFINQIIKDNWYREAFIMMIVTGMREGEIAALKWKDIDYTRQMLTIKETVTKDEFGKADIGTPKSDESYRTIPLNADIKQVLEDQKNKMESVGYKNEYVFVTSRNTHIAHPSEMNNILTTAMNNAKRSGIPFREITSHALRSTFATRFAENRGQVNVLKELMGHVSIETTMRIYSQVLEENKRREMNNINILSP